MLPTHPYWDAPPPCRWWLWAAGIPRQVEDLLSTFTRVSVARAARPRRGPPPLCLAALSGCRRLPTWLLSVAFASGDRTTQVSCQLPLLHRACV